MLFLKDFFEKVNFAEKNQSADAKKSWRITQYAKS